MPSRRRPLIALVLLLVLPGLSPAPAGAEAPPADAAALEACHVNCRTIEMAFDGYLSVLAQAKKEGFPGADAMPAIPTLDDLVRKSLTLPVCPAGGTYTLAATGGETAPKAEVACSAHGQSAAIDKTLQELKRQAREAAGKIEDAKFDAQLARDRITPPTEAQIVAGTSAKRCESNLRTIEGATELLLKDQPAAAAAGVTPALLLEKKVLLSLPRCAAGGVYAIVVKEAGGLPVTEVTCSLHGKVGAIREAADPAAADEPATAQGTPEPARPEPAPAPKAAPAAPPDDHRKLCRSNLRELVSAGMMYLMTRNVDTVRTLTPAQLVEGKFLKRERSCPDGGTCSVEVAPGKATATCTKHGTQ